MYLKVAKKHRLDCGADHICLTSENAHLKNYVLKVYILLVRIIFQRYICVINSTFVIK